jgi:hypothetical protein
MDPYGSLFQVEIDEISDSEISETPDVSTRRMEITAIFTIDRVQGVVRPP